MRDNAAIGPTATECRLSFRFRPTTPVVHLAVAIIGGLAVIARNPAGAEAAVVRGNSANVDRRNLARFSFLIRRDLPEGDIWPAKVGVKSAVWAVFVRVLVSMLGRVLLRIDPSCCAVVATDTPVRYSVRCELQDNKGANMLDAAWLAAQLSTMAIRDKLRLDDRFSWSFTGVVLAVGFGVFAIYATLRESRPNLVAEIENQSDVLDVHRPLRDLALSFRGQDIQQQNLNLRIFTIRISNKGREDVLQGQYDQEGTWGIRISSGQIIEVRLGTTNSPYLASRIGPEITGANAVTLKC